MGSVTTAAGTATTETGTKTGTAAGGEPDEVPLNRAQRRAAPRVARRMAVTETGVPLSAGLARRLACDATIIPIVLGAASEPLDVGRATRLIPPAIRRALIARDRGCAFPGCRRPPRWCDVALPGSGGQVEVDPLVVVGGAVVQRGVQALGVVEDDVPEQQAAAAAVVAMWPAG
jgi:hypothetical protein